jgi:hypothetical protein
MKKILFLILVVLFVSIGLVFAGGSCASTSTPHPCPNRGCMSYFEKDSFGGYQKAWDVCSRSSCNVVRWRDTNHSEGNNSCNCEW